MNNFFSNISNYFCSNKKTIKHNNSNPNIMNLNPCINEETNKVDNQEVIKHDTLINSNSDQKKYDIEECKEDIESDIRSDISVINTPTNEVVTTQKEKIIIDSDIKYIDIEEQKEFIEPSVTKKNVNDKTNKTKFFDIENDLV
jgi:hypothetical protein